MSTPEPHQPDSSVSSRSAWRRTVRVPLIGLVAVVLVSTGAGLWLGGRLPWGKATLTVESGTALLHDRREGFASFDGGDGFQIGFDVESIVWSTGSTQGEGGPVPCLREGHQVAAQAGYRWVRLPDGGARPFLLWLRC